MDTKSDLINNFMVENVGHIRDGGVTLGYAMPDEFCKLKEIEEKLSLKDDIHILTEQYCDGNLRNYKYKILIFFLSL